MIEIPCDFLFCKFQNFILERHNCMRGTSFVVNITRKHGNFYIMELNHAWSLKLSTLSQWNTATPYNCHSYFNLSIFLRHAAKDSRHSHTYKYIIHLYTDTSMHGIGANQDHCWWHPAQLKIFVIFLLDPETLENAFERGIKEHVDVDGILVKDSILTWHPAIKIRH